MAEFLEASESPNKVTKQDCERVLAEGLKEYKSPVRHPNKISYADAQMYPKIPFGDTTKDVILDGQIIGSITPVKEKIALNVKDLPAVELKSPLEIAKELSSLVLDYHFTESRNNNNVIPKDSLLNNIDGDEVVPK